MEDINLPPEVINTVLDQLSQRCAEIEMVPEEERAEIDRAILRNIPPKHQQGVLRWLQASGFNVEVGIKVSSSSAGELTSLVIAQNRQYRDNPEGLTVRREGVVAGKSFEDLPELPTLEVGVPKESLGAVTDAEAETFRSQVRYALQARFPGVAVEVLWRTPNVPDIFARGLGEDGVSTTVYTIVENISSRGDWRSNDV